MLEKVKGAAYDGMEIGIPSDTPSRHELRALLNEFQLDVIALQYQSTGEVFDDYLRLFEQWVDTQRLLDKRQNLRFVDIAQKAEQRYGIPISTSPIDVIFSTVRRLRWSISSKHRI
ncbi:MAG: hypothetical protein ACREV7_16120 [Steroidobacteraceae bacterium]